jgi:hypothetical protein
VNAKLTAGCTDRFPLSNNKHLSGYGGRRKERERERDKEKEGEGNMIQRSSLERVVTFSQL